MLNVRYWPKADVHIVIAIIMVAFRYVGATKPIWRRPAVYLPEYLRHVRLMYERDLNPPQIMSNSLDVYPAELFKIFT